MALALYRALLYLASPVFLARFLWRAWKNPHYLKRAGERLGFATIRSNPNRIWIHAVSVGEVNAAIPLINALKKKWPEKSIIITTMTTTGADRLSQVFGGSFEHRYMPYDFPGAVNRFINRVEPELVIIMETELWPNLIHACHKNSIPLIYANVRLSERSFKGYRRVRSLISPQLTKVHRFAVQAKADAERLIALGARKSAIEVTGSLKFDMEMPASVVEAGQSVQRQIGHHRQVVVAASTHEGEEQALLEMFLRVQPKVDYLLLVLVPRHPERFDAVFRLCQKKSLSVVRRSQNSSSVPPETEVLLVDLMGLLPQFIFAGDVTFMGGSLVPTGGHNLLEPAALGRAVVFGPHMFNFAEISRLFLTLEAGIQVQNAMQLDDVMIKLLGDVALRTQYADVAENLIRQNRGALQRVIKLIESSIV